MRRQFQYAHPKKLRGSDMIFREVPTEAWWPRNSKYMPHQSVRECARRVKQLAKGNK